MIRTRKRDVDIMDRVAVSVPHGATWHGGLAGRGFSMRTAGRRPGLSILMYCGVGMYCPSRLSPSKAETTCRNGTKRLRARPGNGRAGARRLRIHLSEPCAVWAGVRRARATPAGRPRGLRTRDDGARAGPPGGEIDRSSSSSSRSRHPSFPVRCRVVVSGSCIRAS